VIAHRASASKTAELFQCAYPFRPDVELTPDETGPAARIGNAIDALTVAFVEGAPLSAQEAARRAEADEAPVVARWVHLYPWLADNIQPGVWSAQLWLVWDARTDTTRATTRELARKISRGPLEITSVLDIVAQTGPDEVTLYDVKSGKVAGAKADQLLSNAVAARRYWGVNVVRSAFVFAHEDAAHRVPYEFSSADLDAHAFRLEASMLEVPESQPMPGEACRFCRVAECAPGDAHRKYMGWRRKS
jgi:hypothetical protein